MLPIEAGCMAIITKGIHAGEVVSVIKFIGCLTLKAHGVRATESDHWEIDKNLRFSSIHSKNENVTYRPYRRASWMMRIDGLKFEVEQESKEKAND